MIAFAALIFAQAMTPLPAVPATSMLNPLSVDEIAARLAAIQANVGQSPAGSWQCALTGSTGSPYVDDRLCQATVVCTIRENTGRKEFGRCMRSERNDMLDDYSDSLKR